MPVLRGEEPEGGRDGGTEVTYRRIRRKVAQKESYNVSYFAGIKKPFGCFACSTVNVHLRMVMMMTWGREPFLIPTISRTTNAQTGFLFNLK